MKKPRILAGFLENKITNLTQVKEFDHHCTLLLIRYFNNPSYVFNYVLPLKNTTY